MNDLQAFELETFLTTERAAIEAARARVVDELLADVSATVADRFDTPWTREGSGCVPSSASRRFARCGV